MNDEQARVAAGLSQEFVARIDAELLSHAKPRSRDRRMEEMLERAREAGATSAGYVLLRLPHEVAPLFKEWLATHYPLKAEHVMSLVQQMSGGRDYDSRFGIRQSGTGELAGLIAKRFEVACRRLGLNADDWREPLDTTRSGRRGWGHRWICSRTG